MIRSLGLVTLSAVGGMAATQSLKADPPARIARVSYLTGSVSLRPGGLDEWVPATLSYPLSTGAELWSDNNGRAEVHIGGSALWLGPRTLVDLQLVGDTETQLRLTEGRLYLRVQQLVAGQYEIDTPTGAVSLLQDGTYRIDVGPDGSRSTITVRQGQAEVSSGGGTMRLGPGESLVIDNGTAPLPAPSVAIAVDDWEQWAVSRGLIEDRSPTLRYVSPDLVGFEALDNNGTWQINADFGPVWVPDVPAGWAPYRFGSWTWIDPWGWTWIDDAPWGFAPSHYGRWAFLENEWAWVPGQIVEPVYAPALVGFLGGSGLDLSLSLGGVETVAWFPLGPGDIYVPPFQVTEEYVREINRASVRVTDVDFSRLDPAKISYRYRALPGAVTAVSEVTFVRGAPVSKAVLRMPADALASARVIGTTAPVNHDGQRPLPLSMNRSAPSPPAAALERQVVTRRSVPSPTSTAERQPLPSRSSEIAGGNVSAKSSGRTNAQQSQIEREQLLARQAAERAELERRQQSELTSIQAPEARQQVEQRQAQERAKMAQRHSAELQGSSRKRRR